MGPAPVTYATRNTAVMRRRPLVGTLDVAARSRRPRVCLGQGWRCPADLTRSGEILNFECTAPVSQDVPRCRLTRRPARRPMFGPTCWADGMIYSFSDSGGRITLVNPGDGSAAGTFEVAGQDNSWAMPVVLGGRLYLRHNTNLYCYEVKAK